MIVLKIMISQRYANKLIGGACGQPFFQEKAEKADKNSIFAASTTNSKEEMKKVVFLMFMLATVATFASAQKQAEIKFEETTHDFGTFSQDSPKVSCAFKFTNTGDDLLIIHQAITSCGCTVTDFTKEPIKPGEGGEIKVTYDGTHKYPGRFKKSVTVRTNAKTSTVRLYVSGEMTASQAQQ